MSFTLRWPVTAGILIATFALAACGGTPDPTPSAVSASPTSVPSPAVAELDIDISSGTVWKEVFDTLTASEQTCIRGALGDELDQTLGQPVLAEGDVPTDADVSIFLCLDPGVARAVFIAGMISAIEAEEDADLSEAEESCLLDSVADIDVAGSIAAMAATADPGAVQPSGELFGPLFACLPDLLVSALLEGTDFSPKEFSEEDRSCLRDWMADPDVVATLIATDEAGQIAAIEVIAQGLVDCVPDVLLSAFLSGMGMNAEDLSVQEASCLRNWAAGADWAALIAGDEAGDIVVTGRIAQELVDCVPDALLSAFLSGLEVNLADLSEGEASCLRDWAARADWEVLLAAAEDSVAALAEIPDVLVCLPDEFVPTYTDDLSSLVDDATLPALGKAVAGAAVLPECTVSSSVT